MKVERIVVGAFQVNCWIVWDPVSARAVVIDPGSEAETILKFIQDRGLNIGCYLLTHGHVDHVSALPDLWDALPAPIAIHKADLDWAFTESNNMLPFYSAPKRPGEIQRLLVDGQTWDDHGLKYKVISTSGHTPGSVCFFFERENLLFSGDTLFAGSVGRTDLCGGDSRLLDESLKKLARLPDNVTVYTGHGPDTNIGIEKRTNYFMQRHGHGL